MPSAGPAELLAPAFRPYEIESLALPPEWPHPMPVPRSRLDPGPSPRWPALVGGAVPSSAENLYWFRWVNGHQVSFLAWQLLAAALDETLHGTGARRADAAGRVAAFTRCYSAMLIYCSSCPRILYHDLIRPRMVRQHPAFSGTWSRDYRAVARFLRGRAPFATLPHMPTWHADQVANVEIHEAVAAKLVPDGRSLLREAQGSLDLARLPAATASLLYDDLFRTERAEAGFADLLIQLFRRVAACEADLTANGLFPPAVAEPRRELTEFLTPSVVGIVEDLPAILTATLQAAIAMAEPIMTAAHGSRGYQ
jgi:L-tyrosine peroxygenase